MCYKLQTERSINIRTTMFPLHLLTQILCEILAKVLFMERKRGIITRVSYRMRGRDEMIIVSRGKLKENSG